MKIDKIRCGDIVCTIFKTQAGITYSMEKAVKRKGVWYNSHVYNATDLHNIRTLIGVIQSNSVHSIYGGKNEDNE